MTDIRREKTPLWSTEGEAEVAKGFCSNMGDTKYACVRRRTKLPGGVHGEKVTKLGRRSCNRQLTVCNLFWFGPVTSEELTEEVVHNHFCLH